MRDDDDDDDDDGDGDGDEQCAAPPSTLTSHRRRPSEAVLVVSSDDDEDIIILSATNRKPERRTVLAETTTNNNNNNNNSNNIPSIPSFSLFPSLTPSIPFSSSSSTTTTRRRKKTTTDNDDHLFIDKVGDADLPPEFLDGLEWTLGDNKDDKNVPLVEFIKTITHYDSNDRTGRSGIPTYAGKVRIPERKNFLTAGTSTSPSLGCKNTDRLFVWFATHGVIPVKPLKPFYPMTAEECDQLRKIENYTVLQAILRVADFNSLNVKDAGLGVPAPPAPRDPNVDYAMHVNRPKLAKTVTGYWDLVKKETIKKIRFNANVHYWNKDGIRDNEAGKVRDNQDVAAKDADRIRVKLFQLGYELCSDKDCSRMNFDMTQEEWDEIETMTMEKRSH